MSLQVSIELDDDDLQHFRLIMLQARKTAAHLTPEDIVLNAETHLRRVGGAKVPTFISERLAQLEVMIKMLADHEWRLPNTETTRVLNVLAYFAEPEDLIPDHIPGLGYLDDAIMIELAVRELSHEIEAYRDFCVFRDSQKPKPSIKLKSSDVTREEWLKERRKELQSRMRRRRRKTGDLDTSI